MPANTPCDTRLSQACFQTILAIVHSLFMHDVQTDVHSRAHLFGRRVVYREPCWLRCGCSCRSSALHSTIWSCTFGSCWTRKRYASGNYFCSYYIQLVLQDPFPAWAKCCEHFTVKCYRKMAFLYYTCLQRNVYYCVQRFSQFCHSGSERIQGQCETQTRRCSIGQLSVVNWMNWLSLWRTCSN